MHKSWPTANTLSRWLHRSGTLPHGAVAEVHLELEFESPISKLFFLTATYSADAPPDLPRRLVVKTPHPSTFGDGNSEVKFYRQIAPILGTPPLARCLATIEDDGAPGTIVIEDLRSTHDHRPWPLPPSRTQCELALDALVRVHAQWWESPTLGHSVGKLHTPESLTSMVRDGY